MLRNGSLITHESSTQELEALTMKASYKKIDDTLVLMHQFHGRITDLPEIFNRLEQAAGDAKIGPPVVVHHWPLTDDKGRTMDVCIPLAHRIESDEFEVTTLEGGMAATAVHEGPYPSIGETYANLVPEIYKHGHPVQENGREVYHSLDLDSPDKTVVEIQAMLVGFEENLATNLQKILGDKDSEPVISELSALDMETEQPKRSATIAKALRKLDDVATDEQKYEILSPCGHQFPKELIDDMRELYRKTKSIDTVIEAMRNGHAFYPKLRREGDIIYDRKGPARKEAFEKAETRQEKMRATCFCPLLKDVWDEMPWTFCYCAAGWPKRLLEGILEQPVRVEVNRALTKGDDYCEFAIHLPKGVK